MEYIDKAKNASTEQPADAGNANRIESKTKVEKMKNGLTTIAVRNFTIDPKKNDRYDRKISYSDREQPVMKIYTMRSSLKKREILDNLSIVCGRGSDFNCFNCEG